jgi:AraC-like DNA-binding protein
MGSGHLEMAVVRLGPNQQWESAEDGLTFVFHRSGEAIWHWSALTHRLTVGDVLVLNGRGGKVRPAVGGEIVFGSFSLRMEHMYPLLDPKEVSLLRSVIAAFREPKFFPASGPVAAECNRLHRAFSGSTGSATSLAHRSQLLCLAATILSVELANSRGRIGADALTGVQDRVIEVLAGLSADTILSISAEDLASRLNCGRRHLDRQFRRYFGISFCGLKMEMRLLKAASLLSTNDSKIIQVAEESGFNHLGLFNTCFKKRFGVSPGEWRKQNNGRMAVSTVQIGKSLPHETASLLEPLDGPADKKPLPSSDGKFHESVRRLMTIIGMENTLLAETSGK